MVIYTIGFTKKTAAQFFSTLRDSHVRRLVDVRLNNVSQLAGFTKRDDLKFFLKSICDIEYVHRLELAPLQDMLDQYKKSHGSWSDYEKRFISLMAERKIEGTMPRELFDEACLLCSEETAEHCHRRLVAEYLREKWSGVEIRHLR